jgi:hypothetical protein
MNIKFCLKLSLEVKHSAFNMIPEANDEVCDGNSRHPHDPKKVRMSKSQMKTLLIIFFNIKDIVHFEFISQGRTVNQPHYVELLEQLHEVLHRKRPKL